jgi:hypothetical protein
MERLDPDWLACDPMIFPLEQARWDQNFSSGSTLSEQMSAY